LGLSQIPRDRYQNYLSIEWYDFDDRVVAQISAPAPLLNKSLSMLRFGILTRNQYIEAGEQRRYSGSRVSYGLLNVGENPTREQIQLFEDINFTLRTSNGTCRTTFRDRLRDVDAATIEILKRFYLSEFELVFQDRAVSHGLTSLELAQELFQAFPNSKLEASDRLLYLVQLSLASGEKFILEPEGQPLQYIKPPFVVSLAHEESRFLPINRLIAAQGRRRLRRLLQPSGQVKSLGVEGCQVSHISCVHPEARTFSNTTPQFQLLTRSVFDVTPDAVHVLRMMNILNEGYFSDLQLKEGSEAAFRSLRLGGVWIVGRTLESDFSNHVTFLQKLVNGWRILARIGKGSEMERYAVLASPDPCILVQ
jgi:hypothetical protein